MAKAKRAARRVSGPEGATRRGEFVGGGWVGVLPLEGYGLVVEFWWVGDSGELGLGRVKGNGGWGFE